MKQGQLQHAVHLNVQPHPNCTEINVACTVRESMYTTGDVKVAVQELLKQLAFQMNCEPSRFTVVSAWEYNAPVSPSKFL